MIRVLPGRIFAALLACSFTCCSLIVDEGDQQCNSNAECADSVTGMADLVCLNHVCRDITEQQPWGCVGTSTDYPNIPELIEIKVNVYSLISQMSVEGAKVRVCRFADSQCFNPLAGPIDTDADGIATFQVQWNFVGFIEVTDNEHMPTLVMARAFDTFREGASEPFLLKTPVATEQQLGDLLSESGVEADFENEGQLIIWTTDCRREPADNVVLSLGTMPSGVTPFYFIKSLPSTTATHSDETGQGGFINTPSGIHTVTATVDGVGTVGEITALSRPGWITYSMLSQLIL